MAGTISQAMQSFGSRRDGNMMMKFILTCTADSANGSFPPTTLGFSNALRGFRLESMETDPGPVSPTGLYDVTVTDAGGYDLLGGAGVNRSATVTERAVPVITTGIVGTVAVNGNTTINITGNSVNSAQTTITLFFSK